ncbi:hypothetical protein H2202_007540 [Exophiala xenobiotica]|nr:hypothetical protein H2202_007540 [Exophiala xenobiotica]
MDNINNFEYIDWEALTVDLDLGKGKQSPYLCVQDQSSKQQSHTTKQKAATIGVHSSTKSHISYLSSFHFSNTLSNDVEEQEGGIYDNTKKSTTLTDSPVNGTHLAGDEVVREHQYNEATSGHQLTRSQKLAEGTYPPPNLLYHFINQKSTVRRAKLPLQGLCQPVVPRKDGVFQDKDDLAEDLRSSAYDNDQWLANNANLARLDAGDIVSAVVSSSESQHAVQQAEHGPLQSVHTLERGTSAPVQDVQDVAPAYTLNRASQKEKTKTKSQGIVVPSKDRSKYFLTEFDDPEEVEPPEDATLEDICWNYPNHLTKDKYLDMFTTQFWSARDKFATTRPEVQAQWKKVRGADDAWNFLQKRADKRDVELGPERVRALVEGPKAVSKDGYKGKRNPLNLGLNSNAAKRKSSGERTKPAKPAKRQRTIRQARVSPELVAEAVAPDAVEADQQPDAIASGAVAGDPRRLATQLPVDINDAETVPTELAEFFAEDFITMCERNVMPISTLEEPLGAFFGLTFWSSTVQFERLMTSLCTSLQETWGVARLVAKRNIDLGNKDVRSIVMHGLSLCGWPPSCVNWMFAHFDQLPAFHSSSFNNQMEEYERFIQGNLGHVAITLIKGFVFDHLLVFGEEAFCERLHDLFTMKFVRFIREGALQMISTSRMWLQSALLQQLDMQPRFMNNADLLRNRNIAGRRPTPHSKRFGMEPHQVARAGASDLSSQRRKRGRDEEEPVRKRQRIEMA